MVTVIILFLLLAGCCCAPLNRRKLTATLMAAALVSFEAVGSGFVPSLLVKSLQARFVTENHPAWGARNAIIVLGRGTLCWPGQGLVGSTVLAYSRIVEAVRLYGLAKRNQCPCRILISGGDASGTGVSEAAAYGAVMLQLGVEPADILPEGRSLNTFQNAEFSAALLRGQSFDKLFLVTSGLHLRRALLYFGHFGVHLVPCAADRILAHPSILPVGYNFAVADFAVHE